jgi:hypothetical protein
MARPRSGEREYILARWLPTLINIVGANPATKSLRIKQWDTDEYPLSYEGLLDVDALAEFIASRDRRGFDRDAWRINLLRWIRGERKPSPDLIRRCSQALRYDWLMALGQSGYHKHALCILWGLYCNGNRARLAAYAPALFWKDDFDDSFRSNRAKNIFAKYFVDDAIRFTQLDEAAKSCWDLMPGAKEGQLGKEKIDGTERLLPEAATAPPSMLSSPLHTAWRVADDIFSSSSGSFEHRLRSNRTLTAQAVHEWVKSFVKKDKAQNLPRTKHRTSSQ